jgi:hypothetical protein
MNKFLVAAGVFLMLAGWFELLQGDGEWWIRVLQGLGIALAGIALGKRRET